MTGAELANFLSDGLDDLECGWGNAVEWRQKLWQANRDELTEIFARHHPGKRPSIWWAERGRPNTGPWWDLNPEVPEEELFDFEKTDAVKS